MRLLPGSILSIIFFLLLQELSLCAQVITTGPDSVIVSQVPAVAVPDTAAREKGFFLNRWDRPAKAAFYSAILPGLGQAYNKKYWKIPVVYAALGTSGYFVVAYSKQYNRFKTALLQRSTVATNLDDAFDEFRNHPNFGIQRPNARANLERNRARFRRGLEISILTSLGLWGMNVVEAHVNAHMMDFDVSDHLSFNIQPDLINSPTGYAVAPGLRLTLYTRTK